MLNSPIDEIKSRLDIVDVVKDYIKLEKAGINYRANCPFHSEKTPSFFVSPSRQTWRCFGSCSEGGDIFGFVMKIEGIEFADALRVLANKAGIELQKQDPKIKTEKQRIYEVCEWATKFFEKQMDGKTGKEIRKYLAERGIGDNEIEDWRIGYASEEWDELVNFLTGKGYSGAEVEKAGLAGRKEGSLKYYDRFRGRIMFPIFDLGSQVIGFGGRIFETGEQERNESKYLNTQNTVLYDKSKVLYGMNKARNEIRLNNCCILTEGYTDVIMSHKAETRNTVSTSGTALTQDQLLIVKRYTDNLVTAFDMDTAGGSATMKGIDLALSMGFNVRIAFMPDGLDPADLVLKDKDLWQKTIKEAISIMDFYFKSAFSGKDISDPENKKKIASELMPKIARIPNSIERDYWIQKLSDGIQIKYETIVKSIGEINQPASFSSIKIEETSQKKKNRKELLEEKILGIVIKESKFLDSLEKESKDFFSEISQEIINCLESKEKDIDQEIKDKIDYLAMKNEIESQDQEDAIEEEYQKCICEIKQLRLKSKLEDIGLKIKEAEKKENLTEVKKLTEEFNAIALELEKVANNSN